MHNFFSVTGGCNVIYYLNNSDSTNNFAKWPCCWIVTIVPLIRCNFGRFKDSYRIHWRWLENGILNIHNWNRCSLGLIMLHIYLSLWKKHNEKFLTTKSLFQKKQMNLWKLIKNRKTIAIGFTKKNARYS